MINEHNMGKFPNRKVPLGFLSSKIPCRSWLNKCLTVPLLLLFAGTLLGSCDNTGKEQPLKRTIVNGVTISDIRLAKTDSYYETSGTVRAKTVSIVASRVMGTITSADTQEGNNVSVGDILAVIDNRDAAQRVAAAEAAVNESQSGREAAWERRALAEVTYRRYRNLYDERVISRQEFDQIEMQKKVSDAEYTRMNQMLERTRANLEEARVHYGFAHVRAPVSGVVTEKKIETGSMATPGMHLYTIEDVSQFKIEAAIDQGFTNKIFRNMAVHVFFEQTGEQIDGKIAKIVPFVNPASRSFSVEIILEKHPSLRSGSYGKVLIPVGKRDALLIPDTSIVERGQLTGVFIVDSQGIITYRLIKTGKTYSGQTEVLSGLVSGEKIIVSGMEKVVDGGIIKQ